MSSLSPPLLEADGRHLEETMAVFPPFCLLSTTLEFFRALFLFYWRCSLYGTIIVSLQPAQFRGVPLAYSWGFITSMWPRTPATAQHTADETRTRHVKVGRDVTASGFKGCVCCRTWCSSRRRGRGPGSEGVVGGGFPDGNTLWRRPGVTSDAGHGFQFTTLNWTTNL